MLVFLFEKIGDTLELHAHTSESFHDIFVRRGEVIIRGIPGSWERLLKAGETAILENHQQEHEIVAMKSDSEVANVYRRTRTSMLPFIGGAWSPYPRASE